MTRLRDLISLNPDRSAPATRPLSGSREAPAIRSEIRIEHSRGSVARPLTDADLLVRWTSWSRRSWARRRRADPDAVDALPSAADITGLLAVIRPAPEASAAAAQAAPAACPDGRCGFRGVSRSRAAASVPVMDSAATMTRS